MELQTSTDPDAEVTTLASVSDDLVEIVFTPEDAARNVAFLVQGIAGTPLWQVLDLQNLPRGAEVEVTVRHEGLTVSHTIFVHQPKPAQPFDVPGTPVAATEAGPAAVPPPPPAPPAPPEL